MKGGIVIKVCKKCTIEKELSEFRTNNQNKDGKDTVCKECRKQQYKENPSQKRYYENNREKRKEYDKQRRTSHRDYYVTYLRKYREENLDSENERKRIARAENKEYFNEQQKKRKAFEKSLDNLHSSINLEIIHVLFGNNCTLTAKEEDVVIDHFIPYAWGHGGTYLGNVYPLNKIINQSKRDFNPFDWFDWAKNKYDLEIHKWNKLIDTLANQNDLSVDEFKDFVYWCEGNKRTLEDIQDNPITSLELWKTSI